MADFSQDILVSIDLEATLNGISGPMTAEQVEQMFRDDPKAFIERLTLKADTIDSIDVKDVKPAEFVG